MTDYTRVTVVGTARKAELVVPSDITLGGLIPRLMELLDEKTGSAARPLTLVRTTGEQLELHLSAADQHLHDGELLHLVRQDEAPPPPEIADVTDVLADHHGASGSHWSPPAHAATGAIAIGALTAVGGVTLASEPSPGDSLVLPGLALVFLLVAIVAGRVRGRWVSIAATAASLGCVPASSWVLSGALDEPTRVIVTISAAAAAIWLVIALGVGVGLGIRPALWGGFLGVVLAALPAGLALASLPVLGVAGITGIVATIACGLLPWYALSASGLTGLDDEVVDGRPRRRDVVLLTVEAAYRTLSWSVVAVALPIAAATTLLLSSGDPWAIGLGGALTVVAALRTRSLTHAIQIATLWAAVIVIVVVSVAVSTWFPSDARAATLFAVAGGAAIASGARLAAHQRASLRKLGNALETIAVVAAFPLLLGVFHVYSDLLGAF